VISLHFAFSPDPPALQIGGKLSLIRTNEPIRVGLLTDEPLRMEGLARIFKDQPSNGYAPLIPVFGNFEELLSDPTLAYVLVDLNAFPNGVETVEAIRRRRPDMRMIVIGMEGNDSLIMDLILAGARAYLDLKAGPRIVRQAVGEVTSGSIWAPRRLLSKLIDRLLTTPDSSLTNANPHLTDRERQVLELLLKAHSNREIASQLGIEERTVKAHVSRLLRKAGVENRVELSMRASSGSMVTGDWVIERRRSERQSPPPPPPPLSNS
jgi:DNA-binding NarL/FixJ family response regulator